MTLDFTHVLLDFNGQPLPGDNGALTALAVATLVCTVNIPNDTADGIKKFERGLLLQKIYTNRTAVELSVEERAELKVLSGRVYSTGVVFPFWNFIESP